MLFPALFPPNTTPLTLQTSITDTLGGRVKLEFPFSMSSLVTLNVNVPIVSMMIVNTETHFVGSSSKVT